MIDYDNYNLKKGIMTATCRSNQIDTTGEEIPQLEVGKTYDVDYIIMGRSWAWADAFLSEYPEQPFNSRLFSFSLDGEAPTHAWNYIKLKQIFEDTYRTHTLVTCRDLSEDRIKQIKRKYNNIINVIHSDIFNQAIFR